MKKIKHTMVLSFMIILILSFMVMIAFGTYKTEYLEKPFIKDVIDSKDINYFYDLYITSNPQIDNIYYFGNDNNGLTLVGYMDPGSETDRFFIKERFPQITEDFINKGTLRFYPKYFLTLDDFNERNERFIYAQSQLCFKQLNREEFHNFYFKLFDMGENYLEDILSLVEEFNISRNDFVKCISEKEFEELKKNIAEVETYGLFGSPWFFIGIEGRDNSGIQGVPSYLTFKKNIRNYGLILGDE